jgi:tRNA threonylcarbamoyladenosine biosynthesis protein TsaE
MSLTQQFTIQDEIELINFIDQIESYLKPPLQIALLGELGAGKTTFVRYLAKKLQITQDISSPTYVYQHEYKNSDLTLEHWDIYRCASLPEDLIEPPANNTIRVIEWADKFEECLSESNISIRLTLLSDSKRLIDLNIY